MSAKLSFVFGEDEDNDPIQVLINGEIQTEIKPDMLDIGETWFMILMKQKFGIEIEWTYND